MSYDKDNIFAKILRGEIPNDTVYEDDSRCSPSATSRRRHRCTCW